MARSIQLTELEVLQSISVKLDQIVMLLAMKSESQDEAIRILHTLGSDWPTIAKATGLKPDAARKRFDRMNKNGSPNKAGKK